MNLDEAYEELNAHWDQANQIIASYHVPTEIKISMGPVGPDEDEEFFGWCRAKGSYTLVYICGEQTWRIQDAPLDARLACGPFLLELMPVVIRESRDVAATIHKASSELAVIISRMLDQ